VGGKPACVGLGVLDEVGGVGLRRLIERGVEAQPGQIRGGAEAVDRAEGLDLRGPLPRRRLHPAERVAAVGVAEVAVVALLPHPARQVTAEALDLAPPVAAVAGGGVAVVALLPGGGLALAIAAGRGVAPRPAAGGKEEHQEEGGPLSIHKEAV
jgi:hypothetical protein